MSTEKERVEKGALWMDKVRPGWANEIELLSFEINDPCRCVIGLIAEREGTTYTTMSERLGIVRREVDYVQRWGELGFDIMTNFAADEQAEYHLLQKAWIEEIHKRRDANGD